MKTRAALPPQPCLPQTPARTLFQFRPPGVFRSGSLACLIAIAALVQNNVAQAANQSWDGGAGGTGTAWFTAANWVGDAAFPGSQSVSSDTSIATFTATGTGSPIGINMNFAGNTLYLGAIDMTGNTARLIGDSSATAGTLQLNGATVNSVANTILRNTSTSLMTIQGTQTGVMGLALGNATDNIIQITSTGGVTISSIISGSGRNLTHQGGGAGVLTLSATNTYTGATTISTGTLNLISSTPFGTTAGVNGSSSISMAAGTILSAGTAAGSSTTIPAPFTLAGAGDISLRIGAGAASTTTALNLNGAIGGATGNLVFTTTTGSFANGTSLFVLGAANNYAGNTTITTGNAANNPVFVRAGTGVINALPTTTVLTFAQVAGGGTGRPFQYDLNGNNQTLAGLDNGGLVPNLRRMLVTSPTAATLTINNTADYTFGGSTLSGGNTTRAQISGNIALTKNGSGTFTLGGTLTGGATAGGNTFSNATTVLGGILVLGETIALQNSPFDTATSITGNSANGLRTTVTTLTLGGLTGNKNFADVFTTTSGGYGSVTALTLNPGTGATPSYSGIIADGASGMTLTKAGAGTQTLSGANTYSGGTTNSGVGGVIIAETANALGTGPLTFTGGRRLVVNTGLDVTNAITIAATGGELGRGMLEPGTTAGTATISGPITFNATSGAGGHLAAPTAGTILHLSGVITSSVQISSRIGTVMLSGGGTGYTNFNLQGGTVQVGAANGMSTAATVLIGGSGAAIFDLNGFSQSLDGITKGANPATITNSSGTTATVLTLTGSTTTNFAGVITDNGGAGNIGVTVNGGSATLSGTNTYSGNTTVSAGTLALIGSGLIDSTPSIAVAGGATFDVSGLTSTFSLEAAQTLSGNGTVVGDVTVNGTVAAGASIGTLTFSGAVTNNGILFAEITNGPSADKIVFSGGTQLGGTLVVTNLGTLAIGNTYDLFDGTLTGSFNSMTLPNGLLHWITNQVTSGGDGTITFTNTAPVAINDTSSVPQGGSVNIPLNNGKYLLATDAESDPITITSVSASLGNVTTDGSSINYTNTSAGATDSISYTVSDGFGGTDTKTVTVHITSATGANLVSATAGGGNAYLMYLGVPGTNYALDKATSIAPPIIWVPQLTNAADGTGRLNYTNLLSLWPTNDFFRTRHVP